jgi:hypothetical protein
MSNFIVVRLAGVYINCLPQLSVTVLGYELMTGDSCPGRDWEIFSSLLCSDRFWDPRSLLSNGYQALFTWG